MTGWIIYDKTSYERNSWFADRLCETTGGRLIVVEKLEFGVEKGIYYKYEGKLISKPDFAIQRCIFPLLSQVLEQDGVRVFNNSRVCDICNDKRKTHLLGCSLGLPMVKTAFSNKGFLNVPKMPFVLKGAHGHGGNEVFYVEKESETSDCLKKIQGDDILFQNVASDLGVDKRVYVLGGEILACVERQAKDGFKSNFSLGGMAVLKDITAEEENIVKKIVCALKPDFVGVDFIYENGQPYLNEVEDIVGTRMLYTLTDIDAAEVYGDYILKNV